ncbi:myristylated membrane protein-putative [Squirrelpox virus]|uniref:Myristylated membrane protein-putative n=1 Tax=Squirrelpox virus TaxID=240426 RepID=U3UBD9_9POXV|nr:myristylated membrane protein-putative [Squirrelpox virus]CCD83288.1 myristylated membrane protein-putative [Squirrelpox virus]
MGAGPSNLPVESVSVVSAAVPWEKFMVFRLGGQDSPEFVRFYEESDVFKDGTQAEIVPHFCLTPDMDPSSCGSFVDPSIAGKYTLTLGAPCHSITFRPGSYVLFRDFLPPNAQQYLADGRLCRFVRDDDLGTDADRVPCCTGARTAGCPKMLCNDYATTDCDEVMSTFCRANPGSGNCLKWLRTARPQALATYAAVCAGDMEARHCSEFVRVARPREYAFADTALEAFCARNPGNRNCWCVRHPGSEAVESEKFLGPRVCWLHECTDDTRDRKWLRFDQDVQRTRCQYVGCTINVDSLYMKNSRAELMTSCGSGLAARGDTHPGEPDRPWRVAAALPAAVYVPVALLLSCVVVYFLTVYARRRIKTRDINARRR